MENAKPRTVYRGWSEGWWCHRFVTALDNLQKMPEKTHMKTKTPTPKEIKKEIEWLKANQKKIRRHNVFGNDNWLKIDAELTVLEEDLSEEDIYDRSNAEGEDDESKEWTTEQLESALYVRQWLDGEEEMSPSKSWGALVGK